LGEGQGQTPHHIPPERLQFECRRHPYFLHNIQLTVNLTFKPIS
jgi:hypothetical protein